MRVSGIGIAVAVAMLAVTAVAAGAATVRPAASACSTANVTTSVACVGMIAGNDQDHTAGRTVNVNTYVHAGYPTNGMFGIGDWEEAGRVGRSTTENGILNFTYGAADKAGDVRTGGWSIDSSWAGIAKAMLVIKGGNGFIAYLLDLTAPSGTWSTLGLRNGGGNQPGISHGTLYTVAGGTPPVPPVPLPAAGWLMLAGLSGLVAVGRRRRAA